MAQAAAQALEVIEPVYGMTRPAGDDHSRKARTNRATYEPQDRAGEFTSVLFTQERCRRPPSCSSGLEITHRLRCRAHRPPPVGAMPAPTGQRPGRTPSRSSVAS
jgi:hypothetical protein